MEANENIDIANVWISEGKDSTRDYYGMLNSIEQMDEVEEVSNPCIVPNQRMKSTCEVADSLQAFNCQREEQCDECFMKDHVKECPGCAHYEHDELPK